MDFEFKDGMCVITKKKAKNCLVLPEGSVYPNREVLFSTLGVDKLSDMYDDGDEYFNETCIINHKKYKKCIKLFNMIYLKRVAFISRQGIDNLQGAMESRPVEEDEVIENDELTVKQLEDLIEDVEPEVQPDIPGVDVELQAIISSRESAEFNVLELQENLDKADNHEIAEKIRPMLEEAQEALRIVQEVEAEYLKTGE